MVVVTAGSRYMDIDAYACCIAYAKLLNLLNIHAKAVSTAELNHTVPYSLRKLSVKLEDYQIQENDEYVIVDVSNPEYFDKFVKEAKVIKIIDHHTGFEEYWIEKINKNANIEFIGAAATLVFEEYEKNNMQNNINGDIARLLMAAILDNTLNFTAEVTSIRDRRAYQKLQEIVKEEQFERKYFDECQQNIEQDIEGAIKKDTKIHKISAYLPNLILQLNVWNKDFMVSNMDKIIEILEKMDSEWMINLICLQDKKSYIIAEKEDIKIKLEKLLNSKFDDRIMTLNNVILRKEIIKKANALEK